MKKIWKLLELLNEYVEKYNKSDLYYTFELEDNWWLFCYDDITDYKWWTMQDEAMVVCSKKFWFIKWLVENDKISNDWIKPRTDLVKEITIVDYKTGDAIWWKNKYTEVEQLIMYLSIQDEPINFLISILK